MTDEPFNYQLVPHTEEQQWIRGAMRELVSRIGWEPFLLWPIVEPTRKAFPGRWSGTLEDAHVVTQRIMQHVRLDRPFVLHGFDLDSDDEEDGFSTGDETWDRGTAGWYAGEHNGALQFGIHPGQVPHAESAAGVMAHEVAHAYRDHHGLVVADRDEEELLTDLTTIVLGFGILTTNNTDRYRSSGDWRETRWSFSKVGYLPPQAMAFALALQAVARGRSKDVRSIARHLEPNQEAAFAEAMRVIRRQGREVLEDLGLPPRSVWESRAMMEVLPAIQAPPKASSGGSDEVLPWNEGRNVFRLSALGGLIVVPIAALIGWAAGALVANAMLHEAEPLHDVIVYTCAALPVIWWLTRIRYFVCSDPDCRAPLRARDERCVRCGGAIKGFATRGRVERERTENLIQDMERWADESGWEECSACKPELPCAVHAPEGRG